MQPQEPEPGDDHRQAGRPGAWGPLHLRLLEQLAPPSLLVDGDGQVLHLSAQAGRYLHHPGGEPSRHLLHAIQPALRAAAAQGLEAVARGGATFVSEPVLPGAGTDPVRVRIAPARVLGPGLSLVTFEPAGREPASTPASGGPRTEAARLLQLEAELAAALSERDRLRSEVQAAESAKDRFLAVLSHELRNPLSSIASASELLLMPGLPPTALEKAAQVVQRQAKAMKVLLDELVDVSRLSTGRLSLVRRPVSIVAVVRDALETTRPLVQAARHEMSVSLPRQEIEVEADAARLALVISNLVGNAAKYTPEGGRIAVSADVFEDEVVITVEDNGIGMDAAEIDRIFDLASQQVDSVHRPNAGLGIGLALSRQIVELHGGWIMASSGGPGKGSQLRVGVPVLRRIPVATPAPVLPAARPPTAAPAAEGELVLVADDNGDAAWGLAKLLELSGFRAVTARGGVEALGAAAEHRPAIALLDIGMPDLSGHEVARRLRVEPWGRDMILIAATGWGQESDVRQSIEAGFDAHLTKPLNVGRVKALVEELIAGRKR